MQYSTNNHLKLMEGTDNVRRQDFVDNFNAIDNGLSKFYVATQSSANVYKITTGLNKTSLANGYSVKVAIPSASNGAVSLIIDGCKAVAVKKPNGNTVTNFKANGVYSLTYYNSVFILASGGVDDVSFSASDLLSGKTANNSDGEKVNGTMPNVGQQTATINAGGKVIITKGYHNGTGYVQANSIGTQLSNLGSTLTSANQLFNGVKAVDKNGNLITGTATIESLGGLVGKSGSFSFDLPAMSNNKRVEVKHDFSKECPNAKIIFGICDYYSPRSVTTLAHSVFIWHDQFKVNTQTYGLYSVYYDNDPYTAQYNKIDNVIILGNAYNNHTNNNTCRWWAIE